MKIKRLILIFLVMGLLVYVSCRKLDNAQIQPENAVTEEQVYTKFFATSPTTLDVVKSIVANIKRQDEERHFVSRLAKKAGYPIWDKAIITASRDISSRIENTTAGGNTGETIIIPLVLENGNTTNAALVVNMEATDTAFQLIYGSAYSRFGFVPSTNGGWNAKDIFHVFSKFDKEIFGHNVFKILDKRLFPFPVGEDTTQAIIVKFKEEQNGPVANTTYTFTTCDFYDVCYGPAWYEEWCNGGCTSSCEYYSHEEYQCTTYNVDILDGESGSGGGGSGGGSGGSGGGGGGGYGGGGSPNWEDEECLDDINTPEDECAPGWIPNPNPTPPATEPIDSMLARYSRAIKDTSVYIYDQLSKPNNIEYSFTGIQFNGEIKVIERTTNNDSLQVFPKVMIGNLVLLFTWHSHVSKSVDLSQRGSFSPDDIDMLRNVRCLKQNFTSFADCRNKRYALVVTDVAKATVFFNNNTTDDIWGNHTTGISGTIQQKDEASIVNVIGSHTSNGISFYVSNDSPNFQNWTLINP